MHTLPFASLRSVGYTVRLGGLGLLLAWMLLSRCTSLRCPAYASSFILDDSLRRATFSLFGPDSLPLPAPKVEKDKNNLIVRVSDRSLRRRMYTIRARKIYATPPTEEEIGGEVENDSLVTGEDIYDVHALLPLDGENVDATDTSVAELQDVAADTNARTNSSITYRYGYDPVDNFNVEQVFYNAQFGHLFVVEQEEEEEEASIEEALQTEFDVVPEAYVEGNYGDELEGVDATDDLDNEP